MRSTPEGEKETRAERYVTSCRNMKMPPIKFGGYILLWMQERLGFAKGGMMALTGIGELDIQAFQFNTGVDVLPWESKLLIYLSNCYCSQSSISSKKDCSPPYESEEMAVINNAALDEKIERYF